MRILHTVLHYGCISLHSQQQCRMVSFTPHPLQHLLFIAFLKMGILSGVRWYLMDILTCIFLIIKNPWTARRSNQSILKEISPGCFLEGLILRPKLQYFGHLMPNELTHCKRPWCWEGLEAGGEGDDRGWDGWMASLTRWTWVWVNYRSWWWTGRPGMLQFMGSRRVGHDWMT